MNEMDIPPYYECCMCEEPIDDGENNPCEECGQDLCKDCMNADGICMDCEQFKERK